MKFAKNNFNTLHIDDNQKTRDFGEAKLTEIQHHLRTFHVK